MLLPRLPRTLPLMIFGTLLSCTAQPGGLGGGPGAGAPGSWPQPPGRSPDPFPDTGTLQTPPGEDVVYRPGQVDSPPRLVACSDYEYPRGKGRLVTVNVRLTVTETGNPSAISVLSVEQIDGDEADGYREAGLAAAASCRYTPGKLRGRAVAVRIQERFYFPRDSEGNEPAQ